MEGEECSCGWDSPGHSSQPIVVGRVLEVVDPEEESEEERQARFRMADVIWASSDSGSIRQMAWEEAQEARDLLWSLGYRQTQAPSTGGF